MIGVLQIFPCFLHNLNTIIRNFVSCPSMKHVATKSSQIVYYFNSMYCNPPALGKDSAHIIINAPYLTYMHGPLCLLLAILCPSSAQDTHGPSGLPHMTYCWSGHSARTPCMVAHHQVRCPNREVGTTQASLAGTPHGATHEWHMVQSS